MVAASLPAVHSRIASAPALLILVSCAVMSVSPGLKVSLATMVMPNFGSSRCDDGEAVLAVATRVREDGDLRVGLAEDFARPNTLHPVQYERHDELVRPRRLEDELVEVAGDDVAAGHRDLRNARTVDLGAHAPSTGRCPRRADDGDDLVLLDQLGDGRQRLGRVGAVVLDEHLDLAPVDTPGIVDARDLQLDGVLLGAPRPAYDPVSESTAPILSGSDAAVWPSRRPRRMYSARYRHNRPAAPRPARPTT